MKTNNQPKLKNKIFIIWGLFISGVILVFLIILLLAINKPQPKIETLNQQHLKSNINAKQEQQTYNAIMNRIEKEIGELTNKKEIIYQPDGKTISKIEIKDADDNLIKKILYEDDGKTIDCIIENDSKTNKRIKQIKYNLDGKTIKWTQQFDSNGDLIKKILYEDDGKTIDCITDYDPKMGEPLKETYYDLDGNITETKTF